MVPNSRETDKKKERSSSAIRLRKILDTIRLREKTGDISRLFAHHNLNGMMDGGQLFYKSFPGQIFLLRAMALNFAATHHAVAFPGGNKLNSRKVCLPRLVIYLAEQ